jgi:C1A family cysteine protease
MKTVTAHSLVLLMVAFSTMTLMFPAFGESRMDNSAPPVLEKSLADIELENQQLKRQIERMKVDLSEELVRVKESGDKVSDQLKMYAPLAEDVWGLRVFEKAKSYLISWITLGGVTALFAGIALFAGAWKYAVDLIDAKVKALSEQQVILIVQKEAESQVTRYFVDHNDEYIEHVEQLTQQFIQQVNTTVQTRLGYGGSAASEDEGASPANIPSVIDYTPQMGGVRQQGSEGSVVGFAVAYALEYQIFKTTKQHVRLSPREIYNLTRKLGGTLDYDSGAQIAKAVTVVRKEGAVEEEVWPYNAGEFAAEAPPQFATAKRYKVKRAKKLTGLDQVKDALSSTGPVVAGITVYESIYGEDLKKTGLVPMPKAREKVVGGHAVCIVAYDDAKKLLKFINSWGDDWGDHGYGYLPYKFVNDNTGDIWAFSM